MSDTINRDYRLTIRLSENEKNVLDALSERFNLDKSATVRKLLLQASPNLTESGQFTPINYPDKAMTITIKKSADD